MGSAASKTASKAPRRYPKRAAGAAPAQTTRRPAPAQPASEEPLQEASPTQQPPRPPRPREPEPEAGQENDLDFAARLHQMGVVQPNPTFSPSSTAGRDTHGDDADMLRQIRQHQQRYGPSNPTLSVLAARRRIQAEQADEADGGGAAAGPGATPSSAASGREFLSAPTIRDILVLRDRGVDAAAIEARLHLKPGVVARLGPAGLVAALGGTGKAADKAGRKTGK